MAIKRADCAEHEIEIDPEELRNMLSGSLPFLEKERILFLTGEITPMTLAGFAPALAQLDNSDGDITVRITSPGGEVETGLAIYDLIRNCHNKVITEAYGTVASIATLIYQAGDERKIAQHGSLMIHSCNMHIGEPTTTEDLKGHVGDLEATDKVYAEIVSKRTKFSSKQIQELCKKDMYYSAKESVKLGFADKIIQGKKSWLK